MKEKHYQNDRIFALIYTEGYIVLHCMKFITFLNTFFRRIFRLYPNFFHILCQTHFRHKRYRNKKCSEKNVLNNINKYYIFITKKKPCTNVRNLHTRLC